MWASGDFAVVGTTLQIVGELLCEAVDIRSSDRILDVAAGNGNATLAAARRFAQVTSTDYVPALLERGRPRAEAEGLDVAFEVADAENLPFPPASFDAVLSTFGVMFAPDHVRRPARCCGCAGPAVASASPRGRRKDSSARCSGSSPRTCRHLPGALAAAVGNEGPPRRAVRWREVDRHASGTSRSGIARGALRRGVPHVLRPGPQSVRGARRRASGGARSRSADAAATSAAAHGLVVPAEYLETVIVR